MPRFKLVFFSPTKDTSRILKHIFTALPQHVGKIGDYESCAFVTRGTGQFRPGPGANPVIGTRGELEFVEEDRVEVVVNDVGGSEEIKGAIRELKNVRLPLLCCSSDTTTDTMCRYTHMKKSHMMFIG